MVEAVTAVEAVFAVAMLAWVVLVAVGRTVVEGRCGVSGDAKMDGPTVEFLTGAVVCTPADLVDEQAPRTRKSVATATGNLCPFTLLVLAVC
jgi:hypothetical protein